MNNLCEIGWVSRFDGIGTAADNAMESLTFAGERYVKAEEKTRQLDDMALPVRYSSGDATLIE